MRDLSWEDFAGAEGAHYEVAHEGHPDIQLTLKKAVELPATGRSGGSFRLEFGGPAEPLLPPVDLHVRREEELAEIFIVPVRQDGEGTLYEAVFC